MGEVDLHLHTSASDGRLSPDELVHLAAQRGLRVIAITDHDSTEGIDAALAVAKGFPQLKVIPGVEVGTDIPRGEVHVLGYFIDHHDQAFQTTLKNLRHSRLKRAQTMVAKLADMGIHIEWQRVLELAGGGSVGRPHVAQAMFEAGYIPSLQEAFIKYIGRDGPAYAEREKMTPLEAVELVVKAKGLAVLAHPADIEVLEELLPKLQAAGLVGLEVYYNSYPPEVVARLEALAREKGLIACGGSDYHGLQSSVERDLGTVDVPLTAAEELIALAENKSKVARR
ncbi:MAG: PHP domain-containing protein [Chloroflexi bacterium]|nr:PHP domain-containing protein [Chloroflexota bacterium]